MIHATPETSKSPAPPILIQARMGSARLPGKTLARLAGRPLLGWLLDRLKRQCDASQLHVLTSLRPENDPLRAFCAQEGVGCISGPEDNVAERFLGATDLLAASAFVRISGDSPLLDPAVVRRVIETARQSPGADLVTTVGSGIPSGFNVEWVTAAAFRRGYADFREPGHFEHVTQYFYQNRAPFQIQRLRGEEFGDFPEGFKMSVDTPEEFAFLEKVVRRLGDRAIDAGVAEIFQAAASVSQGSAG